MDVLAALDELDKAQTKKKPVDVKANTRRNAGINGAQPSRRKFSTGSGPRITIPRPRPSSVPPHHSRSDSGNAHLAPPLSPGSSYYTDRPPSARRISFAEPARPNLRRLRVPTKTDALSSGFPYDSRLFKYGVTAEEWNHFSNEIVQAADVPMHTHVPVLSWTWTFHKSKVLKGVKRQLLYESSDIQRELRRWNKLFRRQGFQASLELPNSKGHENERGAEREIVGDTKEEKERAKLELKRFCMVITPNAEKRQGSIYSRTSSLTRSIAGEGLATTGRNASPPVEQESLHDTIHEHHDEDEVQHEEEEKELADEEVKEKEKEKRKDGEDVEEVRYTNEENGKEVERPVVVVEVDDVAEEGVH